MQRGGVHYDPNSSSVLIDTAGRPPTPKKAKGSGGSSCGVVVLAALAAAVLTLLVGGAFHGTDRKGTILHGSTVPNRSLEDTKSDCILAAQRRDAFTVEAESFAGRVQDKEGRLEWLVFPTESSDNLFENARNNKYIRLTGAFPKGSSDAAAWVDYKIKVGTTGDYLVYLRASAMDGSQDSVFVDIVELKSEKRFGFEPVGRDFDSLGEWPAAGPFPLVKNKVYTLRIRSREVGSAIDAITVQQVDSPFPPHARGPPPSGDPNWFCSTNLLEFYDIHVPQAVHDLDLPSSEGKSLLAVVAGTFVLTFVTCYMVVDMNRRARATKERKRL